MAPLTSPVLEVLRAGHGVAARRELLALDDVTAANVVNWIRRERLVRLERGVLGLPGLPDTAELRTRIALCRCGPGARLGPRTSLSQMRIEGFTTPDPRPDIAVPHTRSVTGIDLPVHRLRLAAADRAQVEGLPALSAARALIVLATGVPIKTLRTAIDDAVRRSWTSKPALRHRAGQLTRHPGAQVLRELFEGVTMDAESEGERHLLPALMRLRPAPLLQVDSLVPGRRLDFAWPAYRYGLEYDGRAHHGHDTGRDLDGLRDLEAGAVDVLVHRITWGMIVHELHRTLELVWRTLSARARLLQLAPPARAGTHRPDGASAGSAPADGRAG